jgi:hypothetical protein
MVVMIAHAIVCANWGSFNRGQIFTLDLECEKFSRQLKLPTIVSRLLDFQERSDEL